LSLIGSALPSRRGEPHEHAFVAGAERAGGGEKQRGSGRLGDVAVELHVGEREIHVKSDLVSVEAHQGGGVPEIGRRGGIVAERIAGDARRIEDRWIGKPILGIIFGRCANLCFLIHPR
jgi:hypothetical protein